MREYLHFYKKGHKLDQYKIIRYSIYAIIIIFCYQYLLIDPIAIKLEIGGLDKGYSNSDSIDILSTLLLAPVLEELFSRGFLSGKRGHFGFIFIQPLIGMLIFQEYWWFFLGIGLFFLAWIFYEKNKRPEDVFLSSPLFYTSFGFTTVFFTILHLGNVESSSSTLDWTFTFLGIMPGAILFGWVRYQAGLGYAMLTHALFNFLTLSLNEVLYL